jgi:hypothetical protein
VTLTIKLNGAEFRMPVPYVYTTHGNSDAPVTAGSPHFEVLINYHFVVHSVLPSMLGSPARSAGGRSPSRLFSKDHRGSETCC